MRWCEQHQVDYVLGLAKNERLIHRIEAEQAQAHAQFQASGKAEHLSKGANPRFIVTSLQDKSASKLYEDMYCARGDMENRTKSNNLACLPIAPVVRKCAPTKRAYTLARLSQLAVFEKDNSLILWETGWKGRHYKSKI